MANPTESVHPPDPSGRPSRLRDQLEKNAPLLLEKAPRGLFFIDAFGRLAGMSDLFCQTLGYTREELLALPVGRWDTLWKRPGPEAEEETVESVFLTKEGRRLPVEISRIRLTLEGEPLLYCFFREIAKEKQARDREQRLQDFTHLLAQASQSILDARDEKDFLERLCDLLFRYGHLSLVWIGHPDPEGWFRILAASGSTGILDGLRLSARPDIPEGQGPSGITFRSGTALYNFDFRKLLEDPGVPAWKDRIIKSEFRSSAFLPLSRGGTPWGLLCVYHGEENPFDAELRSILEELARVVSLGLDRIDSQKREVELRKRERILLDNTTSGIALVRDRSLLHVNPRLVEMFGYDHPEEMLALDTRFLYFDPSEYERVGAALYPRIYQEKFLTLSDVRGRRKNGESFWMDLSASLLDSPGERTVVITVGDVSLRHRQTERLTRLSNLTSLLAEARGVIADTEDERSLLQTLCDLAVKYGQIDVAWIGRPDENGWFGFMVASGTTAALEGLRLSADPGTPEGKGAAGTAWRTGQPHYNFSPAHPDSLEIPPSWLRPVHEYGLRSTAALPLMREGKQWALISFLDRRENAFDPDLQRILEELSRNISQGLERIDLLRREREAAGINRAITENALVGFAIIDSQSRIFRYINAYTLRILGYPENFPVKGLPERFILADEEEAGRLDRHYQELGKRGEVIALNVRLRHREGASIPFDLYGRWIGNDRRNDVLWTFVDARERTRLQERIEHEATHDPLTGLPNRRALEQTLHRSLARARRTGRGVALGLLDIDDFKPVNDRHGHEAGDRLLRDFAARVRFLLRENDYVVRLGGDEFVIVLEDLDTVNMEETVVPLLSRLHQAVETPFEVLPGQRVPVGMTMGMALFPADGEDPDLLIRSADLAMYQLKGKKKTRALWWQRGVVEPVFQGAPPPPDGPPRNLGP